MPDVPRDDRDEDPRPWEQPGAVRRDCAPHRGDTLRALGLLALSLCVFTLCGGLGLVGLPLAAGVWVVAGRDLRDMAAGKLDPVGKNNTLQARQLGGKALLAHALFSSVWVTVFAFFWL